MTTPFLILALGNPILGDEGVGPETLSRLASEYRFPPSVAFLDGGTAGLQLAPAVSDARKVVVIDAVRTGSPAGSVVVMNGKKLLRRFGSSLSPHQIGFRDLVSACRWMSRDEGNAPAEIVLIGIEPGVVTLSTELSDPVEKAIDDAIAAVIAQLEDWGVEVERAEPMAGCPSARPPSFGGTAR